MSEIIITEGDPPVSLARVQMRDAYLNLLQKKP